MSRAFVISALLFVIFFAADADACLTCYTDGTGASGPGRCAWAAGGWCSRTCCNASWGDPCSIPDFYDPCSGRVMFEVSLFENGLPRPQMIPNCRLKAQLKQQRPAEVPRAVQRS